MLEGLLGNKTGKKRGEISSGKKKIKTETKKPREKRTKHLKILKLKFADEMGKKKKRKINFYKAREQPTERNEKQMKQPERVGTF